MAIIVVKRHKKTKQKLANEIDTASIDRNMCNAVDDALGDYREQGESLAEAVVRLKQELAAAKHLADEIRVSASVVEPMGKRINDLLTDNARLETENTRLRAAMPSDEVWLNVRHWLTVFEPEHDVSTWVLRLDVARKAT